MAHDVGTPRPEIRPPRAGFRRPAHLSAPTLEPRSDHRDGVVAFGDTAGLLHFATVRSDDVLLVAAWAFAFSLGTRRRERWLVPWRGRA